MSVYQVVSWNVRETDTAACGQALEAIGEHIRAVHPTARSFRTYRQVFGPFPLRTYVCSLEFESLTALDEDPDTPSCDEVWAPIFALAEPRSFTISVWSDPQRASWFERQTEPPPGG